MTGTGLKEMGVMLRRALILLGILVALNGCSPAEETVPAAGETVPSEELAAEPSKVPGLPDGWTPKGVAADAEAYFWEVFHGQQYGNTPALFKLLYEGLAAAGTPTDADYDSLTQALMYGRLGWTFLWTAAERDYAMKAPEIPSSPPGLSLPPVPTDADGNYYDMKALNKEYTDAIWVTLEKEGVKPLPSYSAQGVQIATYYFAKATNLVMNIKEEKLLQDWDNTTNLAWVTFPGVVTGFYASFNKFPNQQGKPTMPMKVSYKVVPHSRGFNFATHVFGAAGAHDLGKKDMDEMWQMMQLGDAVAGDTILSNPPTPEQDNLFQQFYSLYPDYYPKHHVGYNKDSNPKGIWNKDRTPAKIVKASVSSSNVVPSNFENNFMMLGDTMIATYLNPKDGIVPPENWKEVVEKAYSFATQSPIFNDWAYKESVTNRLAYIKAGDWDGLERVVQNDPIAGRPAPKDGHGPPALPKNPLHYPNCMTCHQNPRG